MKTDPSSNRTPETVVVGKIYEAINKNDIDSALQYFDPQAERIEPKGFPLAGTYRGLNELKSHFTQGRSTWAEGACTPEEFKVYENKVVAYLYVRVRLKNRQDWIEGRFADGFIFKNGKVMEMQTFAERQQALDWATS